MKRPLGITLGAECLTGRQGLYHRSSGGSLDLREQTELVYSLPKFNATVKKWHIAKIFQFIKKWHSRPNRRSFRAVGESCVTNLIPDQYNRRSLIDRLILITVKSIRPFEGRDKQPKCDYCRDRQGADLPSVGNWWLITGLMESAKLVRGHKQPLIRQTVEKICS